MILEQPQAIRTIFFDAGFTLLRPNPSILEICHTVCNQLSLHVKREELKRNAAEAENFFLCHTRLNRSTWADEQAIAAFWIEYYTILLRPFVEEKDEQRLYQVASAINNEFAKHTSWELFPDVVPTLKALRDNGYMLGIVSDWGLSLYPILRQLDLIQYFDCLVVSAVSRLAKPSPMLYEQALQRTNSISDYSLHIGDTYINDILGARAAGITPILLDRPGNLQPDHVDCLLIHSLTELLILLEVDAL